MVRKKQGKIKDEKMEEKRDIYKAEKRIEAERKMDEGERGEVRKVTMVWLVW